MIGRLSNIGWKGKTAKKSNTLRIGILGAANIAPMALITPASNMDDVTIVAVAARDKAKATKFAKKHGIPTVHTSYEDLVKDPNIDAIYNPLPNGLHHKWTIRALEEGKHVLCEKPISSNAKEATEMCAKAKDKGLVLVEAFHYRYHPLAIRMKQIVDGGDIGKLVSISASFTMPSYISKLSFKKDDIRFNYALSGGIMMDAGCYVMNLARFIAGQEPEIIEAKPTGMVCEDVESGMKAQLKFPNGCTAEIVADFRANGWIPSSTLDVQGDNGTLHCSNWIFPSLWHKLEVAVIHAPKKVEQVYGNGQSTYWYQLRAFLDEVRGGQKCETSADDAIKNMVAIDTVYKKAKMKVRGAVEANTDEKG